MCQFLTGLGQLGDIVRRYPESVKSLFIGHGDKLTLAELKRLYFVHFSPRGSNRRNEEEEALFFIEMFLAACESKWYLTVLPCSIAMTVIDQRRK